LSSAELSWSWNKGEIHHFQVTVGSKSFEREKTRKTVKFSNPSTGAKNSGSQSYDF
jgi:hypothetical protein